MSINNLSGCNLIGLSSTLAITLSKHLSPEEIGLLGTFFTSLGDNLAILSTTKIVDKENT